MSRQDKERCSCYSISYRSLSSFFVYFGGNKLKVLYTEEQHLKVEVHSAWKQPTTNSRQHKQLQGEPKLPESHVCDLNIESVR